MILNGPLFASILTVTGFSFFGKNLYNSISIILGVYLYAVFVNKPFSQYIMIGLFGSALSPVVSYITFGMRFPLLVGILLGNLAGIAIGLLLPPLAAQTLVFHRGFTLYNIGFTSGLIAMAFTAVLRLFSYSIVENTLVSNEYHSPLVWIIFGFFLLTVGFGFYYNSFRLSGIREIFDSSGKLTTDFIANSGIGATLIFGFFLLTVGFGFYYNSFRLSGIREIFDSSGKLTTDFIANSGIGATLINVGLVGLMLSSYVLLVGGKLNGPVIGAILSAVGFSAFGCHLKNSFPILVGIFLASLFGTFHEITSTGMLVAAVFGTGLAPISGFYGSFYGVIAGMLHIALVALVHNVSTLHGGLNLYNSGFSTGFVAGILVPILDNFTAVRKEKKTLGKRIIKKNHR